MLFKILKKINEDHIIWFLMFLSALLLIAIIFTEQTKSAIELGFNSVKNYVTHGTLKAPDFETSKDKHLPGAPQGSVPLSMSGQEKPIAKISKVLGEIRLKKAFTPTWVQIYTNSELYEGDQVYGGSISSASVTYYGDGTKLDLFSYSLLRISQDPPEKTEFPREENKTKVFIPPPGPPEFAHLLQTKTVEPPKIPKEEIDKLRAQSKAKNKIVILGPVGHVMLIARTFPSPMAIRLEKKWDNARLWGYLWDRSNSTAPIWSGLSKGSFSNILIPKPGVYSLLIQSEDGIAESPTIEIAAFKREGKKVTDLGFEFNPDKDLAVVYQ